MGEKEICSEDGEMESTVVLKMSSMLISDWKDIIDTAALVLVAGASGVIVTGVVTVMGVLTCMPEKVVMTEIEPEWSWGYLWRLRRGRQSVPDWGGGRGGRE